MIEILAKAIHHTIEYGDFDIYILKGKNNEEHVVLTKGEIELCEQVLCRISSECLPGTALFSAECDCKQQIQKSLEIISNENQGIFIYLRQEGRGHGLATKIRALKNKNQGMNTFDAVECMGLPADVREYSIVKDILDYFQIKSIRCLCNNPDKIQAIRCEGIIINDVINIPIMPNEYSLPHLKAKQDRGHLIKFYNNKNTGEK